MPDPSSPAPHALDLVIDFVNTLDLEAGTDELATPAELTAWLLERGLLEGAPHSMTASCAARSSCANRCGR